jgi:RHS repeat-associated protein
VLSVRQRRPACSCTRAFAVAVATLVALASTRDAGAVGEPSPGGVTASTVSLPSGPGSVAGLGGEVDVGLFSGQVDYGISFELPDGPSGLTPSLGLAYRGELGNGVAGLGWTLGVPAIRRTLRDGVPTYGADDEIEIAGVANGRLVAIGGGFYHVEGTGDRFRIQRTGARWVVTDPSGTRYWFGRTSQSRLQDDGGRVAEWWLETVIHPTGRTIAFEYARDRGQLYLTRVAWGPRGELTAQLTYADRADPVISWARGFEVVTARRLTTVTVASRGEVLRRYALAYEDPDAFALSRLVGVTMTGFHGDGAMPPLSFTYTARDVATPLAIDTAGWRLEDRGTVLHDVDGDGADDLLRLELGAHRWRRNLGGTYGEPQPIDGVAPALAEAQLMDVDGDGVAELVRVVDDTWRVSRLERDGAGLRWSDATIWPGSSGVPLRGADVALADIDGDGRTDVLRASTGGVLYWKNGPGGLADAVGLGPMSPSNPVITPGAAGVRVLDVNGDALADVAAISDDSIRILLGRGDGTFDGWRRVFWPWGPGAVDPRDVLLGDLDRDGLVDLVRITTGHVYWFAGRADGTWRDVPTYVQRPEQADADVTVELADANGNGSFDLVWSSPRGLWALDLAGATHAGMLATIDNGLGRVTTFTYRSSFELSVEDAAAGHLWTELAITTLPVVVEVAIDVGDGSAIRRTRHRVRDAFWDGVERRFGGFLGSTTHVAGANAGDVSYTETTYHPGHGDDRPLRGEPTRQVLRDGIGRLISEVESVHVPVAVAGLEAYPLLRMPFLRETRTLRHEGVAEPIETRVLQIADERGRVVEEHHVGRLDVRGDETVVVRRFTSRDDATWIGGDLVCEEDTRDRDGAVVTRLRMIYGDETSDAAVCAAGEGLVRKRLGWLASEDRWVELERTDQYTAGWNALDVTAGGVTRSLTFDADDFRPATESVTPAPGRVLTWQLRWDAVRGLALGLVDPAGVETVTTYDALGRVETVARAGREPHVRYRYDWTPSRPVTETWTFGGDETALAGSWTGVWSPTSPWRQLVVVSNGAGETLRSASRLDADTWIVVGDTLRDRKGRVVRVAEPFYWDGGDPRAAAASLEVARRQLDYDGLDRLVAQRLPTGAVQRLVYGAFRRQETIDGLAPILTELDGQGRVMRTERTVGGVRELVETVYDAAGRITAMRLQDGALTHVFAYDTLGRLTRAVDPDIGERTLTYFDSGRLASSTNAEGQAIAYEYDAAGRLTATVGEDAAYHFHYDVARDGDAFRFTASRLAWVEEPGGSVDVGYDALARQVRFRRTIRDRQQPRDLVAEEQVTLAPDDTMLRLAYDDGLAVDFAYDGAGRLIGAGDYWHLEEQDAAGRPLRERYGNGVVQRSARDEAGQLEWANLERTRAGVAQTLHDVGITRTPFGAIESIADVDGSGLDHSSVFAYDRSGRLTGATVGIAQPYQFAYRYDGLQNMVGRDAAGPAALDILAGDYRYGGTDALGRAAGPRQLTRIVAPGSGDGATPLATFAYDRAGRQIRARGRTLAYNGLDQLVRVELEGGGVVEHGYGYDGARVYTQAADGAVRYWFSEAITESGGVREHVIHVGDRPIARVSLGRIDDLGGGGTAAGVTAARAVFVGMLALSSILILLGVASAWRRRGWRPAIAALAASSVLTQLAGCSLFAADGAQLAWRALDTRYYHATVGAGPSLITADDGRIVEERRYEPFGASIDAFRENADGTTETAEIDFRVDPQNILNKRTDPDTGWSYHGARWMAPETAQWLTPDPPVKAPDAAFASRPWALHPYQYVEQNPIAFWDPDGRKPKDQEPTDDENAAMDAPMAAEFETYTETYTEDVVVTETHEEIDGKAAGLLFASTALAGGVLADDATVVGVLDDPLLVVAGIGFAIGWAMDSTKTVTVERVETREYTRTKTRLKPLVYVTYTKYNPTTGELYVGRTCGYGSPATIVAIRDAAHHKTADGFGPAAVDKWIVATLPHASRAGDISYWAIRGREQQVIDSQGGAWSDSKRGRTNSGNAIRGVAKANPMGTNYHTAASAAFGELHAYTGL